MSFCHLVVSCNTLYTTEPYRITLYYNLYLLLYNAMLLCYVVWHCMLYVSLNYTTWHNTVHYCICIATLYRYIRLCWECIVMANDRRVGSVVLCCISLRCLACSAITILLEQGTCLLLGMLCCLSSVVLEQLILHVGM